MFHFITEKGINQIGLANTMADGKIKLLQNMSMEATQKTEKPIRGVSGQHRLNGRVRFYKNFQPLLRPRVP
ncbi:hypothetical protein [uncultured Dialister sp.]|uniref:hypothetical protein n=1 Tax=uncultured Dialister sp. TaxID=278064 RepID=UPI0026114A7F|nr:hypothetical protein [uncultured Dialister sp.]